ncbi:glycosyltransferase [Kocuria salina]|uniref:glycosyltransferase n=1 Tax=Kocuria salina TaxID=1929416 RepID=UPI001593248E|nr:glycosyltransferase [Kocuria salina]
MSENTVAVWKNSWLPHSETFIVGQTSSLKNWKVTTLGFHNLENGLMHADCAPFPNTPSGKALRRAFRTKARRNTYMRHLESADAALMHAHFGSGGIYSLPLSESHGIPHVTTFHGSDTHQFGSNIPGAESWYRRSLTSLFGRGDRFIAVSRYLADRLMAAGAPAEKIDVIYTGTPVLPAAVSSTRDGIAFVGRLIEIKGAEHLLRAVAAMKHPRARSIPISIAGDGPLRPELTRLASKLGLDCTFLGHLPKGDIPGFLARHSIFCAPSIPSARGTREGFGMVFLEASLQELPVVAYASGGVSEAVSHGLTGLLASEGDIEQLSSYLERLVLDPEAARAMGTAGRARVISEFSLELQTGALESLYSDLTR